jgi:isopenicillin-N N-acyltransferase-like protein
LSIIQQSYIPAIELHYPTGLEELRGIADGASVSLEEIVMLNGRYDLGRLSYKLQKENFTKPVFSTSVVNGDVNGNDNINGTDHSNGHREGQYQVGKDYVEECTSAFFFPETTASGDSLACQNWDMDSHLYHDDLAVYLEVHPDPSENRPSMFLLTEVGQLIRTGMNSAGLAVTANSILCTDDFVPVSHTDAAGVYHEMVPKLVLPITLARRLFLEYDNFSDGLVAINSMPCHVSGNLHVSTAEGFGMGLEKTPSRVYRVYAKANEGYVFHSNHILGEGYTGRDDSRDRYPGGSSWFRLQRLERSLKKDAQNGSLTSDIIHAAFSDHLGYPESLCCHDIGKKRSGSGHVLSGYTSTNHSTVANVIYNLAKRTITVCKGPPCKGVFEEFHLKEARKGYPTTFTGLKTVG